MWQYYKYSSKCQDGNSQMPHALIHGQEMTDETKNTKTHHRRKYTKNILQWIEQQEFKFCPATGYHIIKRSVTSYKRKRWGWFQYQDNGKDEEQRKDLDPF